VTLRPECAHGYITQLAAVFTFQISRSLGPEVTESKGKTALEAFAAICRSLRAAAFERALGAAAAGWSMSVV